MAKSISSLAVILSGSATGFNAMIGSAERKLQGFSGGVKAAMASIGAGISAYAVTNWAKETIKSVSSVVDMSAGLSMTTDQFTRLSYAAGLAGVSNESLNATFIGMDKVLASASDVTSESAKTFRELGLSVSDMLLMSPDQRFIEIVRALEGIGNSTQRADTASKLFGKSYKAMMPVINGGADALMNAQQQADRLGITISQFDASRIDDAGDSMDTLGRMIDGASAGIMGQLSPLITVLIGKFTELGTNQWGAYTLKAVQWVAEGVGWLADITDVLKIGFKSIQYVGQVAFTVLFEGINLLGKGLTALINLLPGVEIEWTTTFDELAKGARAAAEESAQGVKDAWANFGSSKNKVTQFFDDMASESDKLKQKQIEDAIETERQRAEAAKMAALDMAAQERDLAGKTTDKKNKSGKATAKTVLSQTIMEGAAGSIKAIAEIKNSRAERLAEMQLDALNTIASNTKTGPVNNDEDEVI